MKLPKALLIACSIVCVTPTYANSTGVFEWTDLITISRVQLQGDGTAVAIWAGGFTSWFPSNHNCSEKTLVYVTVTNVGSERGYDQFFSQIMLAQATGKKVRFGAPTNDCLASPENVYFRPSFMQIED